MVLTINFYPMDLSLIKFRGKDISSINQNLIDLKRPSKRIFKSFAFWMIWWTKSFMILSTRHSARILIPKIMASICYLFTCQLLKMIRHWFLNQDSRQEISAEQFNFLSTTINWFYVQIITPSVIPNGIISQSQIPAKTSSTNSW